MESAYTGFADLYDTLMSDVDHDAWADYIARLIEAYLPNSQAASVADAACGTGAISVRLAERGYHVTGVDLSADMLRNAQQKARARGLQIPFVQQDVRSLALHKPVDAITACCDGVNYLTSLSDADAFFAATYRALRPGGLLLFDISSAYKLSHVLDRHTFGEARRDCAYIWQNAFDPGSRLIEMVLTLFVREGARYRRADERHIQRAHTREEIDALLLKNGYTTLGCFEAFTFTPPQPETERIQWIARRSD